MTTPARPRSMNKILEDLVRCIESSIGSTALNCAEPSLRSLAAEGRAALRKRSEIGRTAGKLGGKPRRYAVNLVQVNEDKDVALVDITCIEQGGSGRKFARCVFIHGYHTAPNHRGMTLRSFGGEHLKLDRYAIRVVRRWLKEEAPLLSKTIRPSRGCLDSTATN